MQLRAIAVLISVFVSGLAVAAPHGIYPTRQMRELNRLLATHSSPSNRSHQKLVYYGGAVIEQVKVYAVFWGSNVDPTITKQVGGYYTALADSTYLDWLKEYDTNIKAVDGRQGTNQHIGRGSYAGEMTIIPTATSDSLTDADIQAELEHQIQSGALPKPDSNTLFMIYFPPGVSISIDGQESCSSFCAYHEGFVSKNFGNVFYGVMPDMGGACSWGCGFASDPFDTVTTVSSHEFMEAITDPFPTPANSPAYPQAWNTTDGSEIGDLCANSSAELKTKGKTYILQGEFDNAASGCTEGPYQSP